MIKLRNYECEMDKEVKHTAQDLLSIIVKSKKYTELNDFHSLFMDAESIVSGLAFLIGPLREQEQRYRMLLVKHMNDGDSHAKAEAKAKASPEYMAFRKIEDVVELAKEQIMLLKKFKGDLELEYKRS